MPVVLQVLLIVALLVVHRVAVPRLHQRQANVTQILLLAMPLAVAAMAQTHALLVGYLDLSVGAMIASRRGRRARS